MATERTTEMCWSQATRRRAHKLAPHWIIGPVTLVENGIGEVFPGDTEDEAIAFYRTTPACALRKRITAANGSANGQLLALPVVGIYVVNADFMDDDALAAALDECGVETRLIAHPATSKFLQAGPFSTVKEAKKWRDERDENLIVCEFTEPFPPT